MNRARPAFEHALRRRVFEELRKSPVLWNEYLRQKKSRRRSVWQVLGVIAGLSFGGALILLVLPYVLCAGAIDAFGLDLFLGLSGLLATGFAFLFAAALLGQLHRSQTVAVFSHLPVADSKTARDVWVQNAVGMCAIVYVFAFMHGVAAFKTEFGLDGWLLSLGLSPVQVALLVSVGTILAVNRPHWPYSAMGGACVVLTFGLGFGAAVLQPFVNPAPIAAALYRITPGGWVGGAIGLGFVQGEAAGWWGLGAAGLLIAMLVPAVRHLASVYAVKQFTVRANEIARATLSGPLAAGAKASDDESVSDAVLKLDELFARENPQTTTDEIAGRIREGLFLEPRNLQDDGFIERLVLRRLTRRQRDVVDYLAGVETCWTDYFIGTTSSAAAFALLGLVGMFEQVFLLAAGLGIAAINMVLAVPLTSMMGPWPGFRRRNSGGVYLTPWTLLPVDYREIERALFRVMFLRLLFVVPGGFLTFAVMAWMLKASPWACLWTTGAWLLAALFVIVLVVTFHTSGNFRLPTFEWRRLHWYLPLILSFCLLVVGPIFLLILLGAFWRPVVPNRLAFPIGWTFLASAGMIVVGAAMIWYYYRWLYRTGRVDLCSNAASPAEENLAAAADLAAARSARRKLAGKLHGPYWWLRRDVRRWTNAAE